jgi:ubiquinone/menaquinone biosynthesis C-methylase UbiE
MAALAGQARDRGFRDRLLVEHRTALAWTPRLRAPAPSVLEFGCGQGIGALGLALARPDAHVHGIDLGVEYELLGDIARAQLDADLPDNLSFGSYDGGRLPFADASFDVVTSWSVFEHVRRDAIPAVLAELRRVLRADGELFIQIDPLYFSARGAHLYGCCPEPWVHLLEQHDALRRRVMKRPSPEESKQRLWEQYETLNRMTAPELRQGVAAAGFEVQRFETVERSEEPPARLLAIYQRDVLVTSTLYLLARPTGAA